jgi:hypothetical protein
MVLLLLFASTYVHAAAPGACDQQIVAAVNQQPRVRKPYESQTVALDISPAQINEVFGTADNPGSKIGAALRWVQTHDTGAQEKAAHIEAFFDEIRNRHTWAYKRVEGSDGSVVFVGPGRNGATSTDGPAVVVDPSGRIFKGQLPGLFLRMQGNARWPADYTNLTPI